MSRFEKGTKLLLRMHCLEGKNLLPRALHLLNERWVQIRPLIACDAYEIFYVVFLRALIRVTRVKNRFILWNSKTIPLGLEPFPYCVRQGVNTMRCAFYTQLFTSHDFEREEK
jgi:hypothetical protein